jgi:hypothetical protein
MCEERAMTRPTVADPARDGTELRSALTAAVRGTVRVPGDAGYEDARLLHNGAVDNRPAAIVQVVSVADVRRALSVCREHGRSISVRSGGHGFDGAATSGDVVIDVRALRGVAVDPRERTAIVRGGTTWADLDEATAAHGLVVPGSRVGTVGVVGCALAGGSGWLTTRLGRTSDHLVAAECVTADGVTNAVPGGGAAPAVLTAITLSLHPQPETVLAGRLVYRLADAADVIGALGDLVAHGRPEFAPLVRWQLAPAAAYVPGDVVGRPVVVVLPVWIGDPTEGADHLAWLHRAAAPLADATCAMPFGELQRQLDGTSPWGRRRAEQTATLADSASSIIGDLEAAFTDRPGQHGFVELEPASPPGGWSMRAEAQWLERADDGRQRAWVAAIVAAAGAARTTTEDKLPHLDSEVSIPLRPTTQPC